MEGTTPRRSGSGANIDTGRWLVLAGLAVLAVLVAAVVTGAIAGPLIAVGVVLLGSDHE